MSAPRMPNPTTVPAVRPGGTLSPEWVRYVALLVAYIDSLEARIRALEPPAP